MTEPSQRMEAFFTLHSQLLREGPGDRETLDWALGLCDVPRDGHILDAACGSGADVLGLLAHAPKGRVTAIEKHAPFAAAVDARFAGDPRVTAIAGDMAAPPGGPFDLIWCAGAIYFLGVTEGLRAWRPVLADAGEVSFSEPVWLTDTPSPEAVQFWEDYRDVSDLAGIHKRVEAAGYEVVGSLILSDAAWEAYYTPLDDRIAYLRRTAGPDSALRSVLMEADREASVWRNCRTEFGYAQIVARPK